MFKVATARTDQIRKMRIGDSSVIPDGDGDPDVEGAAEERESESAFLLIILRVDIAIVEPGVDRGRHEHPLAVRYHGSLLVDKSLCRK